MTTFILGCIFGVFCGIAISVIVLRYIISTDKIDIRVKYDKEIALLKEEDTRQQQTILTLGQQRTKLEQKIAELFQQMNEKDKQLFDLSAELEELKIQHTSTRDYKTKVNARLRLMCGEFNKLCDDLEQQNDD